MAVVKKVNEVSENEWYSYVAYISMVVIVLAVIYLGLGSQVITGNATFNTTQGTVNVSINNLTAINFTANNINFGAGGVTIGTSTAYLYSNNGTTTGGSWSFSAQNLTLENIGNNNLTMVNVSFGKTADTLIGGAGALYQFMYNDAEAGSCTGGTVTANTWTNTLTTNQTICTLFPATDTSDSIYISIKLGIPSASAYTGSLGDVVTVTVMT
ncbi:MAG: hypothetical protein AABX11_03825 [Nanoarchaeota archaeon]